MESFNYVIKDPVGLHARPAGLLVNEVKKYISSVKIEANGKTADASKLIMLMGLGIKNGQEIKVVIEGEDEATTSSHLQEFFMKNL